MRKLKESKEGKDTLGDLAVEIVEGEFFWSDPDAGPPSPKKNNTNRPKEGTPTQSDDATEDRESGSAFPVIGSTQNSVVEAKRLEPVLTDINLQIKQGELVAIVGRVGAGKTSLLSAMLGEPFQSKGETVVSGNMAYSAQTAWIQNATLRDNVLFGQPFDEDRYWRVMQVCQFRTDLELLQDGDQTIIGERGINLSGGQKQRVSIARAAYSSAETLILDDPMSALDPKVGTAVFEQCILNFLRGRTCVMATNQLNLLPQFDKIIVLAKEEEGGSVGRIVEAGTYEALMRSNGVLAALVNAYTQKSDGNKRREKKKGGEDESESGEDMGSAKNAQNGKSLMQVEERAKGAVKLAEYVAYFKAGGGLLIALLIILVTTVGEAAEFGNTFVVTVWTDSVNPDGSYISGSLEFFSLIYFATAALVAVVALIRGKQIGQLQLVITILSFILGFVYICLTLNASRKLHGNLLKGVLRAPISFFDTTPTGRVMSRFTQDMVEIDGNIPGLLEFFLLTFIGFIISVGTILYAVYFFAVILPFLLLIYYKIIQYYRPVARDAKRLEAISRSPVYAFFSEAISKSSSCYVVNEIWQIRN